MLGEDLPRIRQEIEAMKVLRHQNICQLLQVNGLNSVYWRFLAIENNLSIKIMALPKCYLFSIFEGD